MKVLLVEDQIGEIIGKFLSKWGYQVRIAENGEEAWELLQSERIEFFLIDWMMPGMSGLELIQKIRGLEQYRSTPIVMISGQTGRDNISAAIEAGIDSYIAKPFKAEQLREKIEAVLARKRAPGTVEKRVQRILSGHRAFDKQGETPIFILGTGSTRQEELQLMGDDMLDCLTGLVTAIDELNLERKGPNLGYLLVESTGEVAQLLKRRSIQERVKLVVLLPQCKGNSLLLIRLLSAREMNRVPLLLVLEEGEEVPAELDLGLDGVDKAEMPKELQGLWDEGGTTVRKRAEIKGEVLVELLREKVGGG